MDRFMLIVALVFAPLISGTAAAAEPWSSAAGSGSAAAQGLILENCQTRLANNTYSCKVKPSVGAPFTDTFTFTSPGVTSAHFDLAVGQLPGATFGCACAPSGTFADPIFDSTFVFQCVGPLPVGQIMFQGEIRAVGVIKPGTAVNSGGTTFAFKCAPAS